MEETAQIEDEQRRRIRLQLDRTDHQVKTVTPHTALTPVPETAELKQIGAEIVGGDVPYFIEQTVKEPLFGAAKGRVGRAIDWLKMKKVWLEKRKEEDQEVVIK